MPVELKHSKHSVGQSAYHLVWRPKYNVSVFRHPWVKQVCEDALKESAERHNITIHEMKVMEDHVHMFVELPPTMEVSKALQMLKGASARKFFKKCTVWHRYFAKDGERKPHLWSPGKFYRSVGCVSADVIEKYIKFSNTWDFKYLDKEQRTLTSY